MNLKLISTIISVLFAMNFAFAQPADSELKSKIKNKYSSFDIVSIELGDAKLEKKWEYNKYELQWHKSYVIKLKSEYPGVIAVHYGGVQYLKSGSTYTFDNMLTNGFDRYEGIPIPPREELNKILKEKYDPLNFYSGYMLGYIIDASKDIELAENPKFKWVGLNELRCEVTTTYERKVNDVGAMAVEKGTFQILLERSEDGVNFDEEAKLLLNGEWLPIGLGFEKNTETIRKYTLTQKEQDSKNTLKELGAVKMAEEFKKSLVELDLPEFKSHNHFTQYIHELLIEGDEEKVKSLMYNMLPKYNFEDWSDVVLNQNGKRRLNEVLENLENYKRAFCLHPKIKYIHKGQVSFYDRSKYRHNLIKVFYENDRWYIGEISYTIREDDYAKHEANGETHCDGDLIYIEGEPAFKAGAPVEVFLNGNWYDGEIVRPEMENGGYHVTYGTSGLKEWIFANNVRGRELLKGENVKSSIGKSLKNKKIKVKVPKIKL